MGRIARVYVPFRTAFFFASPENATVVLLHDPGYDSKAIPKLVNNRKLDSKM